MEWLFLCFSLSRYPSIMWKILAQVILWNSWCSNILRENLRKVLRSVFYIFYIFYIYSVCILNRSFEYMWIVMNIYFHFCLNVSWHWFFKIYPADTWTFKKCTKDIQLWTFRKPPILAQWRNPKKLSTLSLHWMWMIDVFTYQPESL